MTTRAAPAWTARYIADGIVKVRRRARIGPAAPCSPYVERYWLPLLGPSCFVLVRKLDEWVDTCGPIYPIPALDLSAACGLGASIDRLSLFARTMARLVDFRFLSTHDEGDIFTLWSRVPEHSTNQRNRLPEWLAAAHAVEIESERTRT